MPAPESLCVHRGEEKNSGSCSPDNAAVLWQAGRGYALFLFQPIRARRTRPDRRAQKRQCGRSEGQGCPYSCIDTLRRFISQSEYLYSSLKVAPFISSFGLISLQFLLEVLVQTNTRFEQVSAEGFPAVGVPLRPRAGWDHPQASGGALGNPVVTTDLRALDVGLRWWRYVARIRDETSNWEHFTNKGKQSASVHLCMTCPPSRSSESSSQAFFLNLRRRAWCSAKRNWQREKNSHQKVNSASSSQTVPWVV